MKHRVNAMHIVIFAIAMTCVSGTANAYTHDYVNDTRSSVVKHVFVSQTLEAEFGPASVLYLNEGDSSGSKREAINETWRGYGFTTSIGVEALKFIRFYAGHSFMNLRQNKSNLIRLSGSRAHVGSSLVFMAPLANLELGGALIGSRYDYTHELNSSDVYGSGYFYSLGTSYFLHSRISLHLNVKVLNEHLVNSGSATKLETMDIKTTNVGAGFSIWL